MATTETGLRIAPKNTELTVHDAEGAEAGTVVLDGAIFGIQPNVPVLHQVVTAQLAARRAGTQSTKTRAEVSGGGKKPFKQKGTGRARQGSERAPHFTGGGIALGPKPRSYRQKTPKKMVQLALRSALSDRASEGRIAVVSSWPWSPPSTKGAVAALAALGVSGRVLVVLSRDDDDAYRSFRNLTDVQVLQAGELNAYDVLVNDWIVFTTRTLPGHAGEPASAEVAFDAPVAPNEEPAVQATTEDAEAADTTDGTEAADTTDGTEAADTTEEDAR